MTRDSTKRRLYIIVAGIPPRLGDRFEALFHKQPFGWRIIVRGDLDPRTPYTSPYASKLYGRLAGKLQKLEPSSRRDILADVNLILLYLAKDDGSESTLFERFGIETLIVPLPRPGDMDMPRATRNEQRRAVNALVQEGVRSVRNTEGLLAVIGEEVTNRDNRTCLLLPPKNFGNKEILRCVHNAVQTRKNVNAFKNDLKRVSDSLVAGHEHKQTCFIGERGLEFRSPGRRARHGCAPAWGEGEHSSCCVLRGRLRFGAPYDPTFHYDCPLTDVRFRSFPNCHGRKKLPRARRHANIAPNDNVR